MTRYGWPVSFPPLPCYRADHCPISLTLIVVGCSCAVWSQTVLWLLVIFYPFRNIFIWLKINFPVFSGYCMFLLLVFWKFFEPDMHFSLAVSSVPVRLVEILLC